MDSLPFRAAMNIAANPDDELHMLQILCSESTSAERRLEIMRSLHGRVFRDPEHQVVFESARSLLSRSVLSADRLAVHLNNRGFPDVELKKYFPVTSAKGTVDETAAPGK